MRWALAIALAGCGFHRGAVPTTTADGNDGDGHVFMDAASDVPPGTPCYGAAPVQVCLMTAPTQMKDSGDENGTDIDTDSTSDCEPDSNVLMPANHAWCVLASTGYTVNGDSSLRGHGSRPLVVVSSGDITIGGKVDLSSSGSRVGAGANPTTCSSGVNAQGLGGAAGGSSAGVGGGGGIGNIGGANPQAGGMAGSSTMSSTTFTAGGCQGQTGGNAGGGGGNGGGALALVANGVIQIDGEVDASGAGGNGAQSNGADRGGGGGGGGGMIVIITSTLKGGGGGLIYAAGGGGGGGAVQIQDGKDGADPSGMSLTMGAAGGSGAMGAAAIRAGAGGVGSKIGTASGTVGGNANFQGGGGGGGGGAGVIVIHAATNMFGGHQSP